MVSFFIAAELARPVHLVLDVLLVVAMRASDDRVVLHRSIIRVESGALPAQRPAIPSELEPAASITALTGLDLGGLICLPIDLAVRILEVTHADHV